MDNYTFIIILTVIAFAALAAVLLVPVYLFLKREEVVSQQWTEETLADKSESAVISESESAVNA